MLHLFGMVAFGPRHVAPYCTCGLIFTALEITTPASRLRRQWEAHVSGKAWENA